MSDEEAAAALLSKEFDPDHAKKTTEKVRTRIGQYVAIRDKLRELEEEFEKQKAPFADLMNKVQGELLEALDTAGAKSIKTELGTAIVNTKWTASLADPQAFMDYVVANQRFDLLDRRANSTAVKEFVKDNPAGAPPPGCNLSAIRTLGVRRPNAKPED